jgi:hypothetical protein
VVDRLRNKRAKEQGCPGGDTTLGTARLAGSGATGEIDSRNVGGSAGGYLKRLIVGILRGGQFRRRAVC